MKKSLLQFVLSGILIIFLSGSAFSAGEFFRSIGSGEWNSTFTWQMSTNSGGTWIAATTTPSTVSSLITVRSPNTVSVSVSVSVDQLTINAGATVSVNSSVTLTIVDGSSLDLTLNPGAVITGAGTLQTQGAGTELFGSSFSVALKINNGSATFTDLNFPYTATLNNPVTIDAGATLKTNDGGYFLKAKGSITNNGKILSGIGSTFIIRSSVLTNNDTIGGSIIDFDTTTALAGSGAYTPNTININSSGNVSLSNNLTLSPVLTINVNTGGTLNPNTNILTLNSGELVCQSGGNVSSSGTFQTKFSVILKIRNGANFSGTLKVNSGTATALNDEGPYLSVFKGTITIDAGAIFSVSAGGFLALAENNVTNNGTISGDVSTFTMKGMTLVNNGIINPAILNFDTVTSISGTGTFTPTNLNINSAGNVSLANNLTFSPATSFVINNGGILNPNTRTFTLNSGTLTLNTGATLVNSGTFQTQGNLTMNIKSGTNFNTPLIVNSGTLSGYDSDFPYTATFNGTITVDAGAVFSVVSGGYFMRAMGNVINNGTINGSGSTFIMGGTSLTNNNLINPLSLNFDSTTSLSGTGTYYAANININGSGNVSLLNNLTFSPVTNFIIHNGGILNPNTRTFTLNSGTLYAYSGSTVSNSGIFQTQTNSINLIIRNGSSFNAPLKVVSGSVTSYDDGAFYTAVYNNSVTVDAGGELYVPGWGYLIRINGNIINNGTINGTASTIRFFGSSLINNGRMTGAIFDFESAALTLQGTGYWDIVANILNGSTVTLGSNHQMHNLNVNPGGTFSLSTFKLSLSASDPLVNNGTLNSTGGIFEYNGTSSQSISWANIIYNRLRINNAAGTYLSAPVTINDTLSVVLGSLNLNSFNITLSPNGFLTETAGNTVTGNNGYIRITRTLNAPSSINVGGLGAVLTTSVNLGSTEVRRGHGEQYGLNGNNSILRYFDFFPTTNSALNATLVFKYDDSELNGKIESSLSLYKSTNSGNNWTSEGGTVNTSGNSITRSGIGTFSRWSASSPSAVSAQIKLVLQGFYNTGTGRLNMRDTVRAYLRNTSSPFAVIDSAQSVIDSVVFTGSFLFANAPSGTYYIQTKHRNALETWSKTGGAAYTVGVTMNYDFTTAAAQAYQSNMIMTGAVWGLYEGDVTQEGIVDLADVILIYNGGVTFATGYVNTDVNGDRIVDLADVLFAYNNSLAFVSKKTP